MKKQVFSKLDLDLYSTKLENGLEIYIVPQNKVNDIYVTFSTKYGSRDIEFVPVNEKKLRKFPGGIAHFLEHQLFAQRDGKNMLEAFNARGADINANTSQIKTTYLFSSPNKFEENINELLNFVQSPHFTDEGTEKEKGIIEQEIKMYDDSPSSVLYDNILSACIVENSQKDPVIGTIESVNSITTKDLYDCYNTFYHPSNMFVVVTGNVNPDNVYNIIKENQVSKFNQEKNKKIKKREYSEPDNMAMVEKRLKMNISVPLVAYNFKINIKKSKETDVEILMSYIAGYINRKIGGTSEFNEKLKLNGIITNNLDFYIIYLETHVIVSVVAETHDSEKLFAELEKDIPIFDVSEEMFERSKKMILSSLVYGSDSIYSINSNIMSDIIDYGKVILDDYDVVKGYKYKDFKEVIEELDFSVTNKIIIEPKKQLDFII